MGCREFSWAQKIVTDGFMKMKNCFPWELKS